MTRTGTSWWVVALAAGVALLAACSGPAPDRVAAEAPSSAPGEPRRVAFVGDSWTAGAGATDGRGYAVLTGEQLGWDCEVLGVNGSGYSLRGAGSTFGERIDEAVRSDPDVVVVQGSLNEGTGSPEALAPAAVDTLTRLRAEAGPDTRIVVLGASDTPGTRPETIDWINDAVEAAADQAGLPFVDVAEENWTDPADRTIWADPVHPNDAGHRAIADRLTPLLEDLVDG